MNPGSNKNSNPIETQHSACLKSAFIAACQYLDASLFVAVMDEDDVFQDMDKPAFIRSLEELFSIRRNKIPEPFTSTYRVSTSNDGDKGMGKPVLHFEFYHYGQKVLYSDFAFLIHEEAGVVIDIFRCYSYSSAYMINIAAVNTMTGMELDTKLISWEIFESYLINKAKEEAENAENEDENYDEE